MDIQPILQSLSGKRPFFISEADFQHALAWEIHSYFPDAQIRLEYPLTLSKQIHMDIWAELDHSLYAIELKYPTRKISVQERGRELILKSHGAQDQVRYDFWKDVQRLEESSSANQRLKGYAILLTNDNLYWLRSVKPTNDADYFTNEGRILDGSKSLLWGPNTTQGTMKGREQPIRLAGKYQITWKDYSTVGSSAYNKFRYLCLEISK